jgi:hypothetical protein
VKNPARGGSNAVRRCKYSVRALFDEQCAGGKAKKWAQKQGFSAEKAKSKGERPVVPQPAEPATA